MRRGLARWRKFAPVCAALASALLLAPVARAHLMPAQQGTINVVGDAVFAAIALPVAAFPGVDDDGDGRLSDAELRRHMASMKIQLARRLRLFDGGQAGVAEFMQLQIETEDDADPGTLLAMMKVRFAGAPQVLRIETDLFGQSPAQRRLKIRATRGAQSDTVVLEPAHAAYQFFRPAWRIRLDQWLDALACAAGISGSRQCPRGRTAPDTLARP